MSKISSDHLKRAAYIYIRQSTLDQVQHNRESQRRQYGLQDRACQLGWEQIVVIDDDLGCSGAGTEVRVGFERLLAAVCQRQVGAVFAIEASRLARNGRDWHTLIEFCALMDTLLIDEDGIYAPNQPNDRLLLGLKGTLSEMELATFRQRAQQALQLKAERGELYSVVPVGYVRSDDDRLEKRPDRRIQETIELVFKKFRELGSIRQVWLWLREQQIELPCQVFTDDGCLLEWKLPVYRTVWAILTNPSYAGAYAHGRTQSRLLLEDGTKRVVVQRVAQADWAVLIIDHHEGYIGWEEYQHNQAVIAQNATMKGERVQGAPRRGEALLAGLLRCGHCGRKLHVSYGGNGSSVVRYHCRGAQMNQGGDKCLSIGSLRLEVSVVRELMRILQPLGLEAALRALEQNDEHFETLRRQRQLALEQAQYEARRAQRQYDAVDPDNRLVAGELERRWNESLQQVRQLETDLVEFDQMRQAARLGTEEQAALLALGEELPYVWEHPAAPAQLKKRIVRTVIEEIVVRVEANRVCLVIHWQGGDHTELKVVKNRCGQHRWKTDVETVKIIEAIARLMSDSQIAATLNRLGKRTAKDLTWTRSRVRTFRRDHQIPVYREGERQARRELVLQEVAARLQVSPMTVRRLIQQKVLPAQQICKGAPWIIHEDDVECPAVRRALTGKGPLSDHSKQQALDFQ